MTCPYLIHSLLMIFEKNKTFNFLDVGGENIDFFLELKKEFKNVKNQFKDVGVNIFAYKPYCMSPNNTDNEIEYAMKATKALGAEFVTAELTTEDNTNRISRFAEKHNVKVGYHAHLQASETAWDFALKNSKNNDEFFDHMNS